MPEETKKRKRVKLRAGDVFEMPLDDGRLGYGVVIVGGGVLYVIILRTLHSHRPRPEVLHADPIALVGWTMDALIYHGRWSIVFSGYPSREDVPYPNWKVRVHDSAKQTSIQTTDFTGRVLGPATPEEIELLDNQSSRSPIAYQDALEALHRIRPWRPDYDRLTPEYLAARVTRPS